MTTTFAARFYESADVPDRWANAESTWGEPTNGSTRHQYRTRPLYAAHPQNERENALADNYRGAGAASQSESPRRQLPQHHRFMDDEAEYNNDGEDDMLMVGDASVLAMTEAERESFAAELTKLEAMESQIRRRAPMPSEGSPRQMTMPSQRGFSHHHDHGPSSQSQEAPRTLDEYYHTTATDVTGATWSHASAVPQSNDPERAIFDKNERWREHVKGKKELLRHEIQAQEASQCTFRPQINAQTRGTGDASRSAASSTMHSEGPAGGVHDRLLQYDIERQRRKELLALQRASDEVSQCTFAPQTNQKAWTQSITPRYLDVASTSVHAATLAEGSHRMMTTSTPASSARGASSRKLGNGGRGASAEVDEECTFRPHINASSHAMASHATTSAHRSTALPAHERLHRRAVEQQRRRAAADQRSGYTIADTTVSSLGAATAIMSGTPFLKSGGHTTAGLSDDFRRRMEDHQRRQLENIEARRQEEDSRFLFSPVIAQRSRAIAEASKGRRHATPEAMSAARQRRRETAEDLQCTFTPKIDKRSATKQRTLTDLEQFERRKQDKIRQMQEDRELQEQGQLTFVPEISEFAKGVDGKVAPYVTVGSLDDYRRFVAIQRRIRQKDIEHIQRERQERVAAEEARECTFRPSIHPLPTYIADIAEELKENRRFVSSHATTPLSAMGQPNTRRRSPNASIPATESRR